MKGLYNLFFRKLRLFSSFGRKEASTCDSLLVHFELLQPALCDPFLESLTNRIKLLRCIGYQVKVTQLQLRTSSEVIGYASYYREEILEFQEELRTQSIMIEEKTIVSRRTYQSTGQFPQTAFCNKSHP